jgi:hypothetical protein
LRLRVHLRDLLPPEITISRAYAREVRLGERVSNRVAHRIAKGIGGYGRVVALAFMPLLRCFVGGL